MGKQLLIIGNGFDLVCGLKSKYSDFFNNCILDTIGLQYGLKQTKRGEEFGFWEKLLLEYYKVNKNIENYNWCNIEDIILKTITKIFITNPTETAYFFEALGAVASRKEPDEIIDANPVKQFILRNCMYFIYNYYRDIAPRKTSKNSIIKEYFTRYLLQELKKLEQRFCRYLKNATTDEYVVKASNLFGRLTNCFKIDEQQEQLEKKVLVNFELIEDLHVLSFNYTNPLEKFTDKYLCPYNNVHGKLCKVKCNKGCAGSSVIFGVDDKVVQSSEESNELRIFSKTYRTLFLADETKKSLPVVGKGEWITIKFFGHSLSEADYSYFQSIFDFYDIYNNKDIALEFYYLPYKIEAKNETTDVVYRLINQYGSTLNNKDQGKNLMHKLILENRIKIKDINAEVK